MASESAENQKRRGKLGCDERCEWGRQLELCQSRVPLGRISIIDLCIKYPKFLVIIYIFVSVCLAAK